MEGGRKGGRGGGREGGREKGREGRKGGRKREENETKGGMKKKGKVTIIVHVSYLYNLNELSAQDSSSVGSRASRLAQVRHETEVIATPPSIINLIINKKYVYINMCLLT